MTVPSVAIKAIPDDILEAAKLDGVNGMQMFRRIMLPKHPAVDDRGDHHHRGSAPSRSSTSSGP